MNIIKIKNRAKAFSLIELMVVIGIIGALSAIAVPSYRTYVIKSKVVEAVTIANSIVKRAAAKHAETGTFPNPLIFANISIARNGTKSFTGKVVDEIHYNYDLDHNRVWGCAKVKEIGIKPDQSGGNRSRVCSLAWFEGDYLKGSCGIWGVNFASEIPVDYLPSGCNCTNLGSGTADKGCP